MAVMRRTRLGDPGEIIFSERTTRSEISGYTTASLEIGPLVHGRSLFHPQHHVTGMGENWNGRLIIIRSLSLSRVFLANIGLDLLFVTQGTRTVQMGITYGQQPRRYSGPTENCSFDGRELCCRQN